MTWFDRIKAAICPDPPKLFHEGQEITPKQKCEWMDKSDYSLTNGPDFGEIVRCESYHPICIKGQWHIHISGYEGYFEEKWFAPVLGDDQLEEMLNDIPELMIKPQ